MSIYKFQIPQTEHKLTSFLIHIFKFRYLKYSNSENLAHTTLTTAIAAVTTCVFDISVLCVPTCCNYISIDSLYQQNPILSICPVVWFRGNHFSLKRRIQALFTSNMLLGGASEYKAEN